MRSDLEEIAWLVVWLSATGVFLADFLDSGEEATLSCFPILRVEAPILELPVSNETYTTTDRAAAEGRCLTFFSSLPTLTSSPDRCF